MKRYTVKVPIVAVCFVKVKAESKEEAIELAIESDDVNLKNVDDWQALECITQGNTIYTPHNSAEVVWEEEIEESEG